MALPVTEPFEPVPAGVPRLDFVVPGFGKCGTTSLCAMLAVHPRVFMPPDKELWFFSRPDYRASWARFAESFAAAGADVLCGEGSTAYLGSQAGDVAAHAIARHFPACRILILARDPLERVFSGVREMHHSGHLFGIECPFDLREALAALPQFIADSLYWERSAPYRALFPPEQIAVVFFEDLRRDPLAVAQTCFRHLGLDPSAASLPVEGLHLNTGELKLKDTPALRWLRRQGGAGPWLAAREPTARERWLRRLGLRRRVGEIECPSDLLAELRGRLAADARQFLRHYGKPDDFWPGVAGLASTPLTP